MRSSRANRDYIVLQNDKSVLPFSRDLDGSCRTLAISGRCLEKEARYCTSMTRHVCCTRRMHHGPRLVQFTVQPQCLIHPTDRISLAFTSIRAYQRSSNATAVPCAGGLSCEAQLPNINCSGTLCPEIAHGRRHLFPFPLGIAQSSCFVGRLVRIPLIYADRGLVWVADHGRFRY